MFLVCLQIDHKVLAAVSTATHRVGSSIGTRSVQQRPALQTERGAWRRIAITYSFCDGERAIRTEDDVSRAV